MGGDNAGLRIIHVASSRRQMTSLVVLGEFKLLHEFEVVESLVTPVILSVDFLQENGLVLDFAQRLPAITS